MQVAKAKVCFFPAAGKFDSEAVLPRVKPWMLAGHSKITLSSYRRGRLRG